MTTGEFDAHSSGSRWHWLRWAGLVALAWVAWRVFGLSQADALAEKDPDAALRWRNDQETALFLKAQSKLAARDIAGADAMARRALMADPLNGLAYRALADVSVASGQPADALRRYELASKRAPRDLPSHNWLAAHYLRTGDFAKVIAHLDAVLRIEPELSAAIFPDLVRIATFPSAQAPLARVLLAQPPWRPGFLAQLSSTVPDVRSAAPLMERLRHDRGSLSDDELSAWLNRLIHDRQWGAAYLTWVAQLPPDKQRTIGNVFNGGFDWEPSNSGFGWRVDRVAGAHVDRAETKGASNGFALRVAFDDQRVPFSHVRELLALSPGRYRLDGRARLDTLRTDLGLIWEVTCVESNHSLASTEPFLGNSPWRSFSSEFTVPDSDCGGQWLQLRLPARIPAEQRIGGVAWFDDLRISRLADR